MDNKMARGRAAQATPQGQCLKFFQEVLGFIREQARAGCSELVLNQGECIKDAREQGYPEILQNFLTTAQLTNKEEGCEKRTLL